MAMLGVRRAVGPDGPRYLVDGNGGALPLEPIRRLVDGVESNGALVIVRTKVERRGHRGPRARRGRPHRGDGDAGRRRHCLRRPPARGRRPPGRREVARPVRSGLAQCAPSYRRRSTAFARGRPDNSRYIGPACRARSSSTSWEVPRSCSSRPSPSRRRPPGQARIRQTAIGLNFIDVYYRTGLYKVPSLPFTPGQEGAGVVDAVGPGVTDLAVGDRVAYAGVNGAYAETRVIAGRSPGPLAVGDRRPDGRRDDVEGDDRRVPAAALRARRARRHRPLSRGGGRRRQHRLPVGEGDRPARSSEPPAAPTSWRARAQNGCDEVIDTQERGLRARASRSSPAAPACGRCSTRSARRPSRDRSTAWRRGGCWCCSASRRGVVPPLDPSRLAAGGSLFLTRPSLAHYVATREELVQSAGRLFDLVGRGAVRIDVGQTYPLRDARAGAPRSRRAQDDRLDRAPALNRCSRFR